MQPGFLIEQDVRAIQDAKIAVYALKEDLDRRGIGSNQLIDGITTISRSEFGKFIDQFDTVWNW